MRTHIWRTALGSYVVRSYKHPRCLLLPPNGRFVSAEARTQMGPDLSGPKRTSPTNAACGPNSWRSPLRTKPLTHLMQTSSAATLADRPSMVVVRSFLGRFGDALLDTEHKARIGTARRRTYVLRSRYVHVRRTTYVMYGNRTACT